MTTIDITNMTTAGLDTLLTIATGEAFELPAGLSNADLDVIKAELIRRGSDAARVGAWLTAYMAAQPRRRGLPGCGYDAAAARFEGAILARDEDDTI